MFGNYRGDFGRRESNMVKNYKKMQKKNHILKNSYAYLFKAYQYQHNQRITHWTSQKHKY